MTQHERLCRAVCLAFEIDPDKLTTGGIVMPLWQGVDRVQQHVKAFLGMMEVMRPAKAVVSLVEFKGRLFVAYPTGVFERQEDGKFRECQFAPADAEDQHVEAGIGPDGKWYPQSTGK